MRILSAITGAYLMLGLAFVANAQAQAPEIEVTKPDIVRLLGELPAFIPIRAEMAELGFSGEKLDLAEAQFARMLNDPLIAGDIADRILAAQNPDVQSAAQAGGLFWPLVDRGLGHLTAREIRYFYRVEQAMLKALSPRNCGLAVKERLAPARLATATGRVAARLETPALKEYYRIQHKAARLGASRPAKRLSAADEKKIVAQINQDLVARIAADPNSRALTAAFDNLDRASNRRACAAGQLFMDTVLDLEGRDQHQALIFLSAP